MRLSTTRFFGLVLSVALGISAAPRPHEGHDISSLSPHAIAPSAATPLAAPGAPWATNGSSPANLTGGHVSGGEKYIVLFDTEHPEPPEVAEVLRRVGLNESHPDIDYVFNNSAFRGFAGSMNSHCIDALNGMTDVKHVDKSVKISTAATESRVFAPWGLQRISQQGPVTPASTANQMKYTYKYERTGNLGQGVDIYVVDTGVNTAHLAFGGRAKMGFSKNGASDLGPGSDQAGHGTHCAGTAAANLFGVASLANIIGVKVLGADGSGSSTDVMRGIDWLVQNHNQRKGQSGFIGSVASMSFGLSGRSPSLEAVINAAVDAGIHISVAAGNEAQDACLTSPAASGGSGADGRGGKAVSVGAMNINEQISGFSNTGRCVDVYAPGETVISTWIGGNDRIQTLSGTSMAAPHVSGLMAFLMARSSVLANSPAYMKQYLFQTGFQRVLATSPSTVYGDFNVLVNNGQRPGVVSHSIDDPAFNASLPEVESFAMPSKPNDIIPGSLLTSPARRTLRRSGRMDKHRLA